MKIDGEITLPGDKSISHRSLIFGALTSGTSKLFNLSDGEDVKSTMSCLKDCNVKIVEKKNYTTVNGKEFSKPNKALHCGNSGTTARLLAGFLANRKIDATLVGDKSLSKRPMHRIIKPLREMGKGGMTTSIRIKSGRFASTKHYFEPRWLITFQSIMFTKCCKTQHSSSLRGDR